MPDETQPVQYSFKKGAIKAFTTVVLPAVGLAVGGLIVDPAFVAYATTKLGALVGGATATWIVALVYNAVKLKLTGGGK